MKPIHNHNVLHGNPEGLLSELPKAFAHDGVFMFAVVLMGNPSFPKPTVAREVRQVILLEDTLYFLEKLLFVFAFWLA
jgi:hypothetical protein